MAGAAADDLPVAGIGDVPPEKPETTSITPFDTLEIGLHAPEAATRDDGRADVLRMGAIGGHEQRGQDRGRQRDQLEGVVKRCAGHGGSSNSVPWLARGRVTRKAQRREFTGG
jgi:hypothetical protein